MLEQQQREHPAEHYWGHALVSVPPPSVEETKPTTSDERISQMQAKLDKCDSEIARLHNRLDEMMMVVRGLENTLLKVNGEVLGGSSSD